MLLKDLNLQDLVDFCNGNSRYNSKPWWVSIYPRLARWLQRTQGRRELFTYIEDDQDPQDYAQNDVDVLLEFNSYKYDHLWKLYKAEYNPLWNVDGTETLTIHREESTERDMSDAHTGDDTVSYIGSEKETRSGNETLEKSGQEAVTRSGNETDAKTGKEKVTRTGNETDEKAGTEKVTRTGNETDAKAGSETKTIAGSTTEAHSGSIQQSRTTYDSSTAYDTDKTTDTTKKATTYGVDGSGTADPYTETDSFSADRTDTHTYNSVADETSFTGRKDTHTYNTVADETTFDGRTDTHTYNSVADTTSFTGRKDTKTYNSVADEKTFTGRDDKTTFNSTHTVDDDSSGTVDETQTRTRGGNIGVTMTQQMEQAEVEFVGMFHFLEQICVDIAGAISYTFN